MSNRLSHKLHPLIVDYKQRCMEKRLAPHFAITNSIVGSTLNLSADLILKDEDWDPLLFVLKSSGANLYDITAIHLWSSVGGRYITASVAKPTKSTKLAPVTPPSVTKHKVLLDIFKALAHFMRISPILIELELAGISSISAATLDALAEGLSACKSLRKLSLARTPLGDEGLLSLAPRLRNTTSLKILCVAGCKLTTKSASILADLVKFQFVTKSSNQWMHMLRHDSLSNVSSESAMPSTFQRLDVSANKLGNEGLLMLLDCLTDPIGLKMLEAQSIGCTDDVIEQVKQVLESNHDICIVDLRGNTIKVQLLADAENLMTVNCRRCVKSLKMDVTRLSKWTQLSTVLDDPDYEVLSAENPLIKSYHQTPAERAVLIKAPKKKPEPKNEKTALQISSKVTPKNVKNLVKPSRLLSSPAVVKTSTLTTDKVDYRIWKEEHENRVKLEARCAELEKQLASGWTNFVPASVTDKPEEVVETVKLMQESILSFHQLLDRLAITDKS